MEKTGSDTKALLTAIAHCIVPPGKKTGANPVDIAQYIYSTINGARCQHLIKPVELFWESLDELATRETGRKFVELEVQRQQEILTQVSRQENRTIQQCFRQLVELTLEAWLSPNPTYRGTIPQSWRFMAYPNEAWR